MNWPLRPWSRCSNSPCPGSRGTPEWPWRTTLMSVSAYASCLSSLHAGAAAAHHLLDFFHCRHGGVARGGHRERAVGGAIINGLLWIAYLQETVDQAAGEAVAATDAVEDLQLRILAALVQLAVRPTDRAPVVLRRGDDL